MHIDFPTLVSSSSQLLVIARYMSVKKSTNTFANGRLRAPSSITPAEMRVSRPSALRRAGLKFGVSTHDEAELSRALDVSPNYIALGPIYPTVLKAMAFAPQGLPRITEWKKKIGKIPLVAIGGITLTRTAGVLQAGADSAAVVTDISLNADPEQRTRDWVKATRGFAEPTAQDRTAG